MEERYARQKEISDWDQKKWGAMRAVVIGDGLLGQQVLENLVATGVGNILCIGDKKVVGKQGYHTVYAQRGDAISYATVKFLRKVNPEIKIEALYWPLRRKSLEAFLGKADVIFETTNDPQTKEILFRYAKEKRKILISGAAERYKGAFAPGINEEYLSEISHFQDEQGIVPSMILGGMMVEEARKVVMPYPGEAKPLETIFWYNLFSRKRFERGNDFQGTVDISGKHVVCVGAGALGTPSLTALLLEGADDLHIIDYDIPSTSNLARQIFYYDAKGRPKALVLAEKLHEIKPLAKITPINAKLGEREDTGEYQCISPEEIQGLSPELIVSCLDNFEARLLLNSMRLPLIHGGTSFSSAKVSLSIPGKTMCPDCQFGFHLFAAEEINRDSCDAVPEPSIITTSKICAGIMTGEALLYLSGAQDCINGYIAYDLFESSRAQVIRKTDICEHGERK